MDPRDQRKRAFSQAFQRVNQPRLSGNDDQAAKRTLSHSLGSTGLHCQKPNQKDNLLPEPDCTLAFEQIPDTQIRYPLPAVSQHDKPALYTYASLQYELRGNESERDPNFDAKGIPPPIMRNQCYEYPAIREAALSTPEFVRGKSMFGPSPYIRPDSSSPLGNAVNPYAQFEIEPASYRGEDSPMSDATTAVGPLTPSALNFGDLSLGSGGQSLAPSPLRHDSTSTRATVRVVPTSSFGSHFPEINSNDVVILFDRGKEARKADRYPLCSASRIFAQLLDGPFLDYNLTRCIRLRGDFPFAITTMLHFAETGHYVFDQQAFTKFPLLTTLDFHIHMYLVGSKYGIVALRDCAINAYLSIAEYELELGFLVLSSSCLPDIQIAPPGFPVMTPVSGHVGGGSVITPIDRFLNSLVLLWKNTESRCSAMRKAVLEPIKRDLNKLLRVPFFLTLLQEMVAFGDDLAASLGDDGLEVQAFHVPVGGRQSQTIWFGV